ncbi:unnamed protein product [Caenorhabditis sp. 36 PRJEB53466]|nr:unnamed protein product [Caenorhabditis sp. 36 PRJEB53466]
MYYSSLNGSNSCALKVFAVLFSLLFLYYMLADAPCGGYFDAEKPQLKSFESSQKVLAEVPSREYPVDWSKGIAILVVITKDTNPNYYAVALKSVECYARAQGYHFILAKDSEYGCDKNNDKFFRRHCVTAKLLPKYSAILFIDGDIGVVNPKKRIEEYLDDDIDVTFYDRHFNFEVMAGSYLVRNTPYAIELIRDFGNYEFKLPNSVHGTDNGAIHIFLAEKLFPNNLIEIDMCRKAYGHSKNFDDLGTYTACIRTMFGASTDFGKVRIMKKGTGWARDDWLTSGVWSPERDFMLHGWKTDHLKVPPAGNIKATAMNWDTWYSPFAGPIVLEKCTPGNTTWLYNKQLMSDRKSVDAGLREYEEKVAFNKIKQMGKIFDLMEAKNG